jgi:hypothetical protein
LLTQKVLDVVLIRLPVNRYRLFLSLLCLPVKGYYLRYFFISLRSYLKHKKNKHFSVFYRNIYGLCKENNCFANRPEEISATSCPRLSRRFKILYCSYLLRKVSLLSYGGKNKCQKPLLPLHLLPYTFLRRKSIFKAYFF